jgi:hypothetical protein
MHQSMRLVRSSAPPSTSTSTSRASLLVRHSNLLEGAAAAEAAAAAAARVVGRSLTAITPRRLTQATKSVLPSEHWSMSAVTAIVAQAPPHHAEVDDARARAKARAGVPAPAPSFQVHVAAPEPISGPMHAHRRSPSAADILSHAQRSSASAAALLSAPPDIYSFSPRSSSSASSTRRRPLEPSQPSLPILHAPCAQPLKWPAPEVVAASVAAAARHAAWEPSRISASPVYPVQPAPTTRASHASSEEGAMLSLRASRERLRRPHAANENEIPFRAPWGSVVATSLVAPSRPVHRASSPHSPLLPTLSRDTASRRLASDIDVPRLPDLAHNFFHRGSSPVAPFRPLLAPSSPPVRSPGLLFSEPASAPQQPMQIGRRSPAPATQASLEHNNERPVETARSAARVSLDELASGDVDDWIGAEVAPVTILRRSPLPGQRPNRTSPLPSSSPHSILSQLASVAERSRSLRAALASDGIPRQDRLPQALPGVRPGFIIRKNTFDLASAAAAHAQRVSDSIGSGLRLGLPN